MTSSKNNPLTPAAINYTLTELARRLGWTDDPAVLPIIYGTPTQTGHPTLFITPANPVNWEALLTRPANSLIWLPADEVMPAGQTLPIGSAIPVLFWGAGFEDVGKPFAEQLPNGNIIFYADIIAATFFMLSRWEETVVTERDEHGRFPATASIADKQGFLERPLIDEYALILQAWIKVLLPNWEPTLSQFSIKLSHDIDSIRRFNSIYQGIRTVGHHLLKQHNIKWATDAFTDIIACNFLPKNNSDIRGIYHLAELSSRYKLDSAFYFKASKKGVFDSGYTPADPLLKPVLKHLQSAGFEIGFHPGYDTFNNLDILQLEKDTLEKAVGIPLRGGRQHYLRFQVPDTWRLWEAIGLEYDSTLGYADHEGFRAGTCHPFHPFDIQQDQELNLWEYPLIIMDGTLKDYRKLTPQESKIRILELAQHCQQVEGTFTLLWHNTSFGGEWRSWEEMYHSVLATLSKNISTH